jgi:2-polyprenyl-6-methoxyphenol hydroxylase-like FAD-dependent oxidoreductase
MSVTLLDKRDERHRIPGETLHPGVECLFKSLGVIDEVLAQRFHRHSGIWRDEGDGQRRFQNFGGDSSGPWLGFQADRTQLNRILQARAQNLGGVLRRVNRLDSARRSDDAAVVSVIADGKEWAARVVLDATGRRSWLAGQLGLLPEILSPSQRIRFGWSRMPPLELNGEPFFQIRRNGWNWVSPLGEGRCAWVELRFGDDGRGMDYPWRIFRECAGQGYYLLGDAACLMDPSAANGVVRALMSGMQAVHLIRAADQGRIEPSEAAANYRVWIARLFEGTYRELHPGQAPDVPVPGRPGDHAAR